MNLFTPERQADETQAAYRHRRAQAKRAVNAMRCVSAFRQYPACQGANCGTTTAQHSAECIAETAIAQGWPDAAQLQVRAD
jgi:hypothetical protein